MKPLTPKKEAASEATSPDRLRELSQLGTDLAKLVAKNSSADPELLRELGSHSDSGVRKNVVSNPNTPSDVLLKLAGQFPAELLSNPVFDLLLLENPNLLADLSSSALRSLLKRDNVPLSFLNWAATHQDEGVLLALAMNPATPKTALEKLINRKTHRSENYNDDFAEIIKLHINWAGEMQEGWHEVARAIMQRSPSWDRITLDQNRNSMKKLNTIGALSDQLLQALYEDVREKIAADSNTSSALSVLARDGELEFNRSREDRGEKVRTLVAQNYNTSIAELEYLIGDHKRSVREAASYHPDIPFTLVQRFQRQVSLIEYPQTSTVILQDLANSQWKLIRLGVAGHPNTPAKVLDLLAEDEDAVIRISTALNENTSIETLEKLSTSLDPWLRRAVACHPNVSVELLETLSTDPDPCGAREAVAAKTQLLEIQKAGDDYDTYLISRMLGREFSHTSLYRQMSLSLNSLVSAIPRNNGIPENMCRGFFCLKETFLPDDPDSLGRMANTGIEQTQYLVASHPMTPVAVLLKLVWICDRWIQERAMQTLTQKADTPADVLQQLVPKANYQIASMIVHHPNVAIATLQELAQSKDWQVRLSVAKHPDLPSDTLAKLAKDKDDRVRQAVAQNRNSSIETLEKLVNDPQSRVRKAAIALLTQIFTFSAFIEQYKIVKQSAASTQELEQLASSAWIQIRVEVARHPNTATVVLEKLATDVHFDVRSAISENINVPATLLEQLLDDKENTVRLAAIANPNMPISTLQELAESKKRLLNTAAIKQLLNRRIEGASKYLEPFAKSSTPSLGRLAVFLHPMAPVELLAKNVRSLSWLERYAIAQNPNTPTATLKTLVNDGNRVVRATAKESLQTR